MSANLSGIAPSRTRPIVLTILDGWGYRAEIANNAIALARKPNYDKLLAEYPNEGNDASWAALSGEAEIASFTLE